MDDFSPLSSPRKPFFFSHHFAVFILSILLLCSVAPAAPASPGANGLLRDSQQLLSLKASLPNPVPAELLDWLPGSSPCNFSNVSCKNGRVASIDLTDIPLSVDFGLISASLVSLESLETLSLKRTNLSGALSSLSRSQCGASLSSVDLAENAISGPVTDVLAFQACSSIVSLNLSMNSLDPPVREVGGKGSGFELQVLDLSFNNLSGAYGTPFLLSSHFSGLRHLSLKGNKLAGDIPVLGFLNLSYLDLSMNNFSIGIPAFKDCSGLQHLDLSTNKFYGDVGAALSSCPNLSFLNLTNNKFTGSIPQLPGGMQYLYLQGNDLQGVIPKSLPDLCSSLVELDLSFNNFSGILPESFSSCSVLELLDLSNNSFTGELPIATLVGMSSLKHLRFSFNNFVGSLPESVSDLVSLETFDVSSNGFSGSIPSGICGNPKNSLQVLYLQNNMLSGPIPEGLRNCTNLVSLDLSFNFLTGIIPSGLGSLSQLKDLIAWLNQLHGEIPQELMHLQNLENLILDFNDLNGSIPTGLSNCTNLNWISLSNNQLTGEIPASFGQLGNLAILKLGNNSLSGSIPAELGDCRSLLWLDLNSNSLSGTIPPGLSKQAGNIAAALLTRKQYGYIKTDGTRQCHGAGNLLEFGGIRQEQLDRLSDRYPCNTSTSRFYRGITQRTFNHNGSMIFLDISHNSLGGSIPKELGSLYYLQILNLGSNNLSGPIPPELAGLKNLAILDLSYNKLAGAIPSLLSSLTFLGEMDVSNNNLSGSIPESAPFDTFPESMFANNSGLCGYPLAKCGSGSGSGSNQHEKSHRRQASLAGSVAMGLLFSLFCILGLVLVSVEMRKRKKKKEEALEAYMESGHSNSATANSNWKVNAREALSISVAAFEKPLRKLTFADLLEATNGFHNDSLIGSGGFGDVYKAVLKDGSCVAIKKLIHVSGQGDREFIAEMETIGKIKHRNLVPLLGYCKVNEERLLVYEYMKYGSLEDVLHFRRKSGIKLNWPARRKIAIGAARGLVFLHHMCIPHIIHRDMKSSNVLLDENLEARVSDFGMARYMNDAQDTHLSVSTLAGTPGYVPPEYYQSFRCSTRGDVYSYGVVLLELLTGRQPTDSADFGDNNLVGWVKQHAKMRISDVFDPVLLKEDPSLEIELLQHLKVACACLDDRYMKRPTMIQVMAMFKEIQAGSGMDSASTIATDEATVEGVEMTMSIKEGNESNHTIRENNFLVSPVVVCNVISPLVVQQNPFHEHT